jgi:hypothetical protein
MRTKALVCAAVLAAGLASSMAQSNVYSLNVVGYYNVTVPQNQYYMVANQLNTTNNQVQYLIPAPQDYTVLYKFISGGYQGNQFVGPDNFGSGWDYPTWTLNPGETAFIKDPATPGGQTFTFVGEVLQGTLSQTIPIGSICFRSSMVPQAATLAALGVPGEDYDIAYVYNNGYSATTFTSPANFGNGWDYDGSGNGPTIPVGQGFAYLKAPTSVTNAWVRNFTVQ